MCLQAQCIDDGGGGGGRLIRARGISDDNRGVGRGQGIDNASELLETTTEVARILGQRQRMRRCNDSPEELATTTKASAENDNPENSTRMTKALAEEAEETTLLRERLRRWRRRCVYGPR